MRRALTPLCCVLFLLCACDRQSVIAVRGPLCKTGSCAGAAADGGKDAGDAAQANDAGDAALHEAGADLDAGAVDAAALATDDGGDADVSVPRLPDYSLVVDAPSDGASVAGTVTVTGRAPAFLNVEIWDAQHQMPPLARTTPRADGSFTLEIDVSMLTPGATTWTVWAWDSPAGQPYTQFKKIDVQLTIIKAPI